MDLKEFVTETIIQIVSGVAEAQSQSEAFGAKVGPRLTGSSAHKVQQGVLSSEGGNAQMVQFDVALTAKEGTGTKGGIGIVAGAINLGSTGQSNEENSSISRVKFSVPISLPNG